MTKKSIRVLCPIYNEYKNIIYFIEAIKKAFKELKNYQCDILFVDDGSTDGSLELIKNICLSNKDIRLISLSRNFGKEVALSAGIDYSIESDAVITIDADLQHPTELIPALVREWEDGYEIIETIRETNTDHTLIRSLGSKLYYFLMRQFTNLDFKSNTTDFRLYDQKVVIAFTKIKEKKRIFRGLMDWLGYSKTQLTFNANNRLSGNVNYSYKKLLDLAVNSFTSFSLLPLRLISYLGVILTFFSFFVSLWMIIDKLNDNSHNFSPIAILAMGNTFLIGVVLIGLGLVAHYVGYTHTEVINRPLYLIKDEINL